MPLVWHPILADNGAVTADNVLLFATRGAPTALIVDGLRKRLVELGAAHPKGTGYVHMIDAGPGQSAPDKEARDAFIDLIQRVAATTRAGLIVIHGRSGFGAAAARATASAIVLAARVTQPIKIFRTLGEGLPWFEGALRKAGASVPVAGTLLSAGTELLRRVEQRAT